MMGFPAYAANTGLRLVASVSNFALQNGIPNILTWTSPNDGLYHPVALFGYLNVATVEVGGQINFQPIVGANQVALFLGSMAVGQYPLSGNVSTALIPPNTGLLVQQINALTSGAASVWLQLWAF
jgi:hypothetical protein